MKCLKSIPLRLIPVLLMALAPLPASPQSDSFVGFTEGDGALDEILGSPLAPCVSRLPARELSLGEGAYSKLAAKNSSKCCREALGTALQSFTDEEKDMLTQYIVMIDSIIDAELPILNSFPWNFAVVCDSTDFGVPSAGNHIILTKGMLRDMQEWLDKQSSMLFVGMEMLVHEKVRMLQSMKPEPFERFYREVWGFRKIPPLSVDRLTLDHGLLFSHAPPNEWVIKVAPKGREYIMPALLLRDAGKGAGGAVQRVAIMVDSTSKGFFPRKVKRGMLDYRDLRLFTQYRKKFPLSEHDYHPAELSADLLAKFLVMKYVSARYGTAPARAPHYSQIDVLMEALKKY